MDILTAFQKKLLQQIGNSAIGDSFYLTGDTALAAFYLFHRYSDDLDFSFPDPTAVLRVAVTLTKISRSAGYKIEFIRTYDTFLECFVENDSGETVKMDFAHDTPYRSKPTVQHAPYTMSIDNLLDIACNKLSALFDRAEPKDFVDVYFVCRDFMSLAELIESTRQKHVGIDNYWLAQAFERVRQVNFLPRMIKPLELEVLRSFFLEEASRLIDNIDPA